MIDVEVLEPPGEPLRAGSLMRETRRLGPKRLAQTVRVASMEERRRLDLRIESGPVPVHGDITFSAPDPNRTTVRLHAHGRAPAPLRWFEPLFEVLARRQMADQYRRLKRVLEAGPSA